MLVRLISIPRAIRLFLTHPITRRQLFRTFVRVVGWQIKSRRDRLTEFEWVKGTRLVACRGMSGATGNLYCGLHEYSDMAFILHFLRPGDLFMDVGANVGSYTVLASGAAGARTVAIEPIHGTAMSLRKNLEANRIEHLVEIVEAAAGAEMGTAMMTTHMDTMNYITDDESLPTDRVPTVTLDSLNQQPAALKLDLEGHEFHALQGATQTLTAPTLKALIVEFDDQEAIDLLAKFGFARYAYDPASRTLSDDISTHFGNNSLYLRDPAFVQLRLRQGPAFTVFGHKI